MIPKVNYFDREFDKKFLRSLRETGFAVVQDAPVNHVAVQKFQKAWLKWFQKDPEVKKAHLYSKNSLVQSGYFPYKAENAKNQKVADLKEFFQIHDNLDMPREFLSYGYFHLINHLKLLAKDFLRLIEVELNTYPKLTESVESCQNSLLRVIHYPPVREAGVRAAAHEDINLITLLPASNQAGLEVLDSQGRWNVVGTDREDLVVNVGDMLQMFSKNIYKSTTHRVSNVTGDKSRISTPFFLHPSSSLNLGKMTAGEYLGTRLSEIGLK